MNERNPHAMGAFTAQATRDYDASPQAVFRAWTDPVAARSWLCSGGDARMDPVVDGLYYLAMRYQGNVYPHYGRYLRVEPARALEFTWMSEGTRGKESVVTLDFAAHEGGTRLTLRHEGLPDEAMQRDHADGWRGLFEDLAKALA